jgi:branched-chain amino acid transport system ATP-binding protein
VDIRDLGITTIIVEQDAMAVLRYSDRAVILDSGEIAFSGSAAEVRDNKQLLEHYLSV